MIAFTGDRGGYSAKRPWASPRGRDHDSRFRNAIRAGKIALPQHLCKKWSDDFATKTLIWRHPTLDSASWTRPSNAKNHRQGIAGGFGGLA